MEGDTVLVDEGVYFENLIIQKNITLTSYAIYDDLSEWTGFAGEYYINNDNISNTRIDGSEDTNGDDRQSTILINSPDECISPTIFGFTITGGNGTNVLIEGVEKRQGGGILSNNALPKINYNFITNNSGDDLESGGAVQQTTDVDFPALMHLESGNFRCEGDVDLSFNFYRDNDALYGNTLGTEGFEGSLDMSNSIFDVYNCPEEEVTPVWVDVEEDVEVDFQYSAGDLCSITEDVWVSPDGDNYNNTGTSQSSAFRTIKVALELIAPQDDDPVTIFLTEGTFSPDSTGESFPILMISNVNLIGKGEEETIIDAEQTGRVITMDNCNNNIISDLTITGGLAEGSGGEISDPCGGGMYLDSSNPMLTNVTIANNTAYDGGGMSLDSSDPILTHVTISNNTSDLAGGGMYLSYSNPNLTHVTISNNTAYLGGGMYLFSSDPILTHVTITDNTAENSGGMHLDSSDPTLTHVTIANNTANYGGGMYLAFSNPNLTNSIIWDNSPESIYLYSGTPLITYSDIEAENTWTGEGNINSDPLFTASDNGDYTLQEDSPCIDTGDPSLWYQDLDGTRADMGTTGGLFVLPNFTFYDFGEVGDIGSSKQFTLYNFRNTPITISSVTFGTSSFTTDASFPMIIEPLETKIISINVDNTTLGYMEDEMVLISNELPEGLTVALSVTGTEGNVLTDNLSGTYPAATYRISGDLTIADGDTAYLQAGTEFLFDGQYNFNIYGTLKAIGTESDSIIFDNFSDERWRGFTLDNASDQTTFEYVRISGAEKYDGGGMHLNSSNPILTHVTISNNTALFGGGMRLDFSNPNLTHVTISENTADYGGGMYLYYSHPILTHVTITDNTAENSGGMHLNSSNPILTHVTISNNTASSGGGMWLYSSNPILTNSIIWTNSPESIYLYSGNEEPIITYSNIEDGWEGEENIGYEEGDDPLFNDDYTLQAESPCIDAGTIIEGMEYCGEAPDMGAYEYCEEEECGAELADVTGDGQINVLDLVQISYYVLELSTPAYPCAADYNQDGQVNILDLVQIANYILDN